MKNTVIKFWKLSLYPIFLFVFVHFLKDVTQDILQIVTPLDLLGDVKEDISFLPTPIRSVYVYGLGGLSVIVELFLLVVIPKVWRGKDFVKLDRWIMTAVLYLLIFFTTAIVLDPRLGLWLKNLVILNL